GLVEAEDGVVPEGSERLPTRRAEEGQRAVFDQEHPVLAAQLGQLFEWLWPAQEVNDEERARARSAEPRQRIEVRLQIALDGVIAEGGAGGADGPHFVAAVVVGDQPRLVLPKTQGTEQVIDCVARPIEVREMRSVERKGALRGGG